MSRIFISYIKNDLAQVNRLMAALQHAGHEAWCDRYAVRAGDSIPEGIERALQNADVMVVCVSRAWRESRWCREELSAGLMRLHGDEGLHIIAVRFEEAELPDLLAHRRWIDLFPEPSWEEGISLLLADIKPSQARPAHRAEIPLPPPPNNLPPQSPLFVGREEELRFLREALVPQLPQGVLDSRQATLHGLGGMGKSSLALTFAIHEASHFPGGIYWIDATGGVRTALTLLASVLSVIAPHAVRRLLGQLSSEASPEERGRATVLALQNQPVPSLLILDGAEAADWRGNLPAGRVRVILTTRHRSAEIGVSVPVGPLSLERARGLADLIHTVVDTEERNARERVLEQVVQCHPLAVTIAARAQHRWSIPWPRLEQELRTRPTQVLDHEQLREGYPTGVSSAIDWALERCSPSERNFLQAAAMFAPVRVPLDWVAAVAGLEPEAFETRQAIHGLAALALIIATTQHEMMLHPLVWRRVREGVDSALQSTLADRMCWVMKEWLIPRMRSPRPELLAELGKVQPHVDEGRMQMERRDVHLWLFLTMSKSQYLVLQGNFATARELCEQVLACLEHLSEIPFVYEVPCRISLANILHQMGEHGAAAAHTQRALSVLEREDQHIPDQLPLLREVAALLRKENPFAGEELARMVVHITETKYGPDAPQLPEALVGLALNVLLTQGPAAVYPLYQRALAITEKNLGRTSSEYAAFASRFAAARMQLGDFQGAQELYVQALDISERLLPVDHPTVASRLTNLAIVLVRRGEAAKALPLFERAAHIQKPRVGLDPTDFANTLYHLGMAYLQLQDFTRAEATLLEADQTCKGIHRDGEFTASVRRSLAQACRGLGKEEEAVLHTEQSLDSGISMYYPILGPGQEVFRQGLSFGHIRDIDIRLLTAVFSKSSEMAERLGDAANAARAALLLGKELHWRKDWQAACPYLERGLRLLDEQDEPVLKAESHRLLGDALSHLERFKEARDSFKAALRLYKQMGLKRRAIIIQASLLAVLVMLKAPVSQRRPLAVALQKALKSGLVTDAETRERILLILQRWGAC